MRVLLEAFPDWLAGASPLALPTAVAGARLKGQRGGETKLHTPASARARATTAEALKFAALENFGVAVGDGQRGEGMAAAEAGNDNPARTRKHVDGRKATDHGGLAPVAIIVAAGPPVKPPDCARPRAWSFARASTAENAIFEAKKYLEPKWMRKMIIWSYGALVT